MERSLRNQSFPRTWEVMNHSVSHTVIFKLHHPGPKMTTPVVGHLFIVTAH
jgi:hypothetical protein